MRKVRQVEHAGTGESCSIGYQIVELKLAPRMATEGT